MKNSIGSLAALAAFAAPALATPVSPPQAAAFNHVAVSLSDSTPINFDIDGDATDDFYVYGNFGSGLRVAVLGSTLRSTALTFGSSFSASSASLTGNTVLSSNQNTYLGFSFVTGGQTHAAWVLFDTSSSAPQVVGGGWQPLAGASIPVGSPTPVPEPASYAALAGAAMLTGALAQRRRRATPPAESA